MKKIDGEVAFELMRNAGFSPLVPYPGIKKPWLSTHIDCGEQVSPTLYSIQQGSGCAYCSGRYISKNVIQKTFSDANLVAISDYKNNSTKMKCKCLVCENIVYVTYAAVRANGKNCKYCAKNYLSSKDILKRFDEAKLKPLEEYINSKTRIKCECLVCGDLVFPRLNQIKNGGRGCKKCASNQASLRSLKTSNIEKYTQLVARRGGKLYITEYIGLKGTYLVECENQHTWYTTLDGLGTTKWCELCARKSRGEKLRKPTSEIRTLFENANLEMLSDFTGIHSRVKGKCLGCGTEVNVLPSNLQRGQGGCKSCGMKIGQAKQRIPAEDAKNRFKENGYEILEGYISNNIPVKAKCLNCGEISYPRLHNLIAGAKTCRFCVPHAPLSQETVEKVFSDFGFTLLERYERSGTPLKCIHSICGKEVRISHNAVISGRGCRFCNFGGFDFNGPGYLYIMYHESYGSIKVGIGGKGAKRDRVKDHTSQGWKLYEKFNFDLGDEAYEVEQTFFRFVRKELNLGVHLVSEQMPQGGFSETIDIDEISLFEVKRLLQDTIFGRLNSD